MTQWESMKSRCCKANMNVIGWDNKWDEGTLYWECAKCHRPCDMNKPIINKSWVKKIIDFLLNRGDTYASDRKR